MNNFLYNKINKLRRDGYKASKIIEFLEITDDDYFDYIDEKHRRDMPPARSRRSGTEYFHLHAKITEFKARNKNYPIKDFTVQDVINKFGLNPVCYLTGVKIDYHNKYSYSLDHFMPASRGGSNELDNMMICHPKANYLKLDYTIDEFLKMVGDIAKYNKLN